MMIDQPHEDRYDVERDIAVQRVERAANIAAGIEVPDEVLREKGGIPLSFRSGVLLRHYAQAHVAFTRAPSGESLADVHTTTRRIIEYIGTLEDVALLPFTTEPGDTPSEAIGLAAASLEQWCTDIRAHAEQTGTPLDPASALGVSTWELLAVRLRHIEERISRIPGQAPGSALMLPDVRG